MHLSATLRLRSQMVSTRNTANASQHCAAKDDIIEASRFSGQSGVSQQPPEIPVLRADNRIRHQIRSQIDYKLMMNSDEFRPLNGRTLPRFKPPSRRTGAKTGPRPRVGAYYIGFGSIIDNKSTSCRSSRRIALAFNRQGVDPSFASFRSLRLTLGTKFVPCPSYASSVNNQCTVEAWRAQSIKVIYFALISIRLKLDVLALVPIPP